MHRLLVLLIAASALHAATKPNFSGDWKLNLAQSDFGKAPPPHAMSSHIEQNDSQISVVSKTSSPEGSYSSEYKWVTDGRDNVNTVHGNEIRASVIWSGPALIANAETSVHGVALTLVDRWTLSDDGRVLTINRTVIAPQGNAEQKLRV